MWFILACTAAPKGDDSGVDSAAPSETDPFADSVVRYEPGAGAGYGQEGYPGVVLGAPEAPGDGGGSLDVLSLGLAGEIVVSFDDLGLVDGAGPDLLVFENAFVGWYEPGVVAASDDGVSWSEWPCDATDAGGLYPGCAGVAVVHANSENGVDATDPGAAGGDAFDLAEIGLTQARFVRVRDAGLGDGAGTSAGFDLDAMAVVNGASIAP